MPEGTKYYRIKFILEFKPLKIEICCYDIFDKYEESNKIAGKSNIY